MKRNRKTKFLNLALSVLMAAAPFGTAPAAVFAQSAETGGEENAAAAFTMQVGQEQVLTDFLGLDPAENWFAEVSGSGIVEIELRQTDPDDYDSAVDYIKALTPGTVTITVSSADKEMNFTVTVTDEGYAPDPETVVELSLAGFERMNLEEYMQEQWGQTASMLYASSVASYDPDSGVLQALEAGEAWLQERDAEDVLYTVHLTVTENPLQETVTLQNMEKTYLSSLTQKLDDAFAVETFAPHGEIFMEGTDETGQYIAAFRTGTAYIAGYGEQDEVVFLLQVRVDNPLAAEQQRIYVQPEGVVLFEQIAGGLPVETLTVETSEGSGLTVSEEKRRIEATADFEGVGYVFVRNTEGVIAGQYQMVASPYTGILTLPEGTEKNLQDLTGYAWPETASFVSSNEETAKIEAGVLKLMQPGRTEITLQTEDGKTAGKWHCTVTVNPDLPAEEVRYTLRVDEKVSLTDWIALEELQAASVDLDSENITYDSQTGELQFAAPGTYAVKVTKASGKVHPFVFTVEALPETAEPGKTGQIIQVDDDSLDLNTLQCQVTPADGMQRIADNAWMLVRGGEDKKVALAFQDDQGQTVYERTFVLEEEGSLPQSQSRTVNTEKELDLKALLPSDQQEKAVFYLAPGSQAGLSEEGKLVFAQTGSAQVIAAVDNMAAAIWTVEAVAASRQEAHGLAGDVLELPVEEQMLEGRHLVSSDESIVLPGEGNRISLLKAGSATVSLEDEFGTQHIIWSITVAEPEVPAETRSVRGNVGQTLDLAGELEEAQKEQAVFVSSDEEVVSVSEDGKAALLKAGSAAVTASVDDRDVVIWQIAAVQPAKVSLTGKTGQTLPLEGPEGVNLADLTLSTDAEQTVSLTEDGQVQLLQAGTAQILGKAQDGVTEVIWTIEVRNRPELKEITRSGYENSSLDLTDLLQDYAAEQLTYASSDEQILSVDENGSVRLLQPGEAVLTVTLDGDPVLKVTVTVRARAVPGWTEDRKQYVKEDGTYACDEWIKDGGAWYAFDEQEQLRTGWFTDKDGASYYLQAPSGKMMTDRWIQDRWVGSDGKEITDPDKMGWIRDANNVLRYRTKDNLLYKDGFLDINGKTYLFSPFGQLLTGWNKYQGFNYYSDQNGVVQKNTWISGMYWVEEDGKMAVSKWVDDGRYYVGADGKWIRNPLPQQWVKDSYGKRWQLEDGTFLRSAWITDNGKTYYLKSDTYACTGWLGLNGDRYLFNSEGELQTGLVRDGGRLYYLDPENGGKMATGWKTIDGLDYYFTSSGAAATGWVNRNGARHYFRSDGTPMQGWILDNGKDHFIHRGKMCTGWLALNGQKFYLGEDGAARKYWQFMDGHWYYFYGSCAMARGWSYQKIGTFYLDPETGYMATGTVEIDGETYEFDQDGRLLD